MRIKTDLSETNVIPPKTLAQNPCEKTQKSPVNNYSYSQLSNLIMAVNGKLTYSRGSKTSLKFTYGRGKKIRFKVFQGEHLTMK